MIDQTMQLVSNAGTSSISSSITLAQVNPYVINGLVGIFLLVSIAMILIVLIQRPQGGGLGGAFGAGGGGGSGGGAGQTAFGTKTGDVLTGGTIAIFIIFVTCSIILNFVTRPSEAPQNQPTLVAPEQSEDATDSTQDSDGTEASDQEQSPETGEVVETIVEPSDDTPIESGSSDDESTDDTSSDDNASTDPQP